MHFLFNLILNTRVTSLQVYFGANSKLFQKLVKLLVGSNNFESVTGTSKFREELRSNISVLLIKHPALLEEFTNFYPDAPPPKRLVLSLFTGLKAKVIQSVCICHSENSSQVGILFWF